MALSIGKCVLIHTYDMLAISHEPRAIMGFLAKVYGLKSDPDTKKTHYKPISIWYHSTTLKRAALDPYIICTKSTQKNGV